jgi:hypothetical protein
VRQQIGNQLHLEVFEMGEELLARAQRAAHAIEEQTARIMAAEGRTGPHSADGRGPDRQGEGTAVGEDTT